MHRIPALLLLVLLGAAAGARGGTLLFLQGEAGDPVSNGETLALTLQDGNFFAQRIVDGAVSVSFFGTDGSHWSAEFATGDGVPLVPGTYENATRWPFNSPGTPGLNVAGTIGCNQLTGRFVVHELTEESGNVTSFAADFEQRCEGFTPGLSGAVRYRAADAGCVGAPPGVPCDDHDACTTGETCQGTFCMPAGPAACAGSPDGCDPAGICDPRSGQCATDPAPDDAACDDGDPCTTDRCAAVTGCVHEAVACWDLRGRTTVFASAAGRSTSQSARVEGILAVDTAAGTYLAPASPGSREICASVPDEVGTVRPGRRGRTVLETTNTDAIVQAIEDCVGYRFRLRRYRQWVKLQADGTLRGHAALAGTVRARGVPVQVSAVSRFQGTPRGAAP